MQAMIYAYIRVSTNKQTVENQRFEINRFAKQKEISKLMCGCEKTGLRNTVSQRQKAWRTIEKNKERGYIDCVGDLSFGKKVDGSNEYTECMYVEKCHPAHGEREI